MRDCSNQIPAKPPVWYGTRLKVLRKYIGWDGTCALACQTRLTRRIIVSPSQSNAFSQQYSSSSWTSINNTHFAIAQGDTVSHRPAVTNITVGVCSHVVPQFSASFPYSTSTVTYLEACSTYPSMSEAKKKFLGLFRSKSASEKASKDSKPVRTNATFPHFLADLVAGERSPL